MSSGVPGLVSAPPPAPNFFCFSCFAIEPAGSTEQPLLHDSQTAAGDQEIMWMQILLEEEEPMRISVPLFPTPPHSQGAVLGLCSSKNTLHHSSAVIRLVRTLILELNF